MPAVMANSPEDHLNILERKVSSHMSTSVLKLADFTSMTMACSIMQKDKKDEIIVMDKNSIPIGIVTDQDILKKIGEAHANPNKTRLDDIMTFPLITIKHTDTLRDALKMMTYNNLKKIPVVGKDGKIIGIIYQSTITNLIRQKVVSRFHIIALIE